MLQRSAVLHGLLLLLACVAGLAVGTVPAWPQRGGMLYTMAVHARVNAAAAADNPVAPPRAVDAPGSLLACADAHGVMSRAAVFAGPHGAPQFLLTCGSDSASSIVTLLVYDAALDCVYVVARDVSFVANGVVGKIDAPWVYNTTASCASESTSSATAPTTTTSPVGSTTAATTMTTATSTAISTTTTVTTMATTTSAPATAAPTTVTHPQTTEEAAVCQTQSDGSTLDSRHVGLIVALVVVSVVALALLLVLMVQWRRHDRRLARLRDDADADIPSGKLLLADAVIPPSTALADPPFAWGRGMDGGATHSSSAGKPVRLLSSTLQGDTDA